MTPPNRRERDLELIDAALSKGSPTASDPGERELQAIALAVRAEAPEPGPEFTAEMDTRLAERFERKRRRFTLRLPSGWVPRLAIAGAAASVIAAVVVALSIGGETQQRSAAMKAPPGAASTLAGRRVERSAQLTLSAPGDRLQDVANGAATAATRHSGFVLSSNVTSGAGASGQLELKVPTGQLEPTLSDIAQLGHVRTRNESGQDMTQPFAHVKSQLGAALVERSTLRLRLRGAHGDRATTIRTRLRTLSGEIRDLNSRMGSLRRDTSFATISVTLQAEHAGGGGLTGGGPRAALHDALRTLVGVLDLLLRALGILLPVGAIGGLAALGLRSARRRRREAVLF